MAFLMRYSIKNISANLLVHYYDFFHCYHFLMQLYLAFRILYLVAQLMGDLIQKTKYFNNMEKIIKISYFLIHICISLYTSILPYSTYR